MNLSPEEKARLAPQTRQPLIFGVACSLMTITTCFCMLRLYVRKKIVRSFGNDDWALLCAWGLVMAAASISVSKTIYGSGRHSFLLSKEDLIGFAKLTTASLAAYQIAFAGVKVAFLIQYRRLFPLPGFQRACKYLICFVVPFGISQALVLIFGCQPISSLWDRSIKGKCIKIVHFWYFNSSINLFTDLVIIILPMPLLRTLQLGRMQKIILMLVFSLGFLVCGISIIRIKTLEPSATAKDVTYDTVENGLWSITEMCCSLICLCVPALKPLVRRWTPDRGTKTSGYTYDLPTFGSRSWAGDGTRQTVEKSRSVKNNTNSSTESVDALPQPAPTWQNKVYRASGSTAVGNDTIWIDDRDDPNRESALVEHYSRAKPPNRRSSESIMEEGNQDADSQRYEYVQEVTAATPLRPASLPKSPWRTLPGVTSPHQLRGDRSPPADNVPIR